MTEKKDFYCNKPSEGGKNRKDTVVYRTIKRAFDFISSLLLGIVLLIPIAVISIIIFVKSPGNPIYKQERVGKHGKCLKVYKFRSMINNADDIDRTLPPDLREIYLREFKLDDDPRVIGYKKEGDTCEGRCFGAKLRNWSLDELPQIIFNICIFGNMSVVGPRPILRDELEKHYSPEEQKILLSVKPGLTGYWQGYARNTVGYEDHGRQDMELYYAQNRSLWFDVKILFKSVGTVISRKGAK